MVGFPDVCMTPSPGGPVPIPYPNLAQSKDLENGSKRGLINGAPVALKDSYLGASTGDEAGTMGGGVASGKTKGRAHPVNYSFDVMIEGKPVVRNLDPFTLNDHNTPPFPILQPQSVPPRAGRVEEVKVERAVERCDWCGKEKHGFERKGRVGSNLGSSAILGRNMLEGRELATHPWCRATAEVDPLASLTLTPLVHQLEGASRVPRICGAVQGKLAFASRYAPLDCVLAAVQWG